MFGQRLLSCFQQQPLVFLLALTNSEYLLRIRKLGFSLLLSYPDSKKQNRSLHTCAQDVQITRMATI
jgi:hypothetical protein